MSWTEDSKSKDKAYNIERHLKEHEKKCNTNNCDNIASGRGLLKPN
jgi:hypothetical protein